MADSQSTTSRRNFLKKAAYVAPVILTLKVTPSMASSGSGITTRTGGCTLNHDHSKYDGDGTTSNDTYTRLRHRIRNYFDNK